MRSSKYIEHYTGTFITLKEIMKAVSSIYHNCVPDKIKNRRNIDQLKQHDTATIACVIWGIINGYINQKTTYRTVCSILFPNGDFPSRGRFTRLSSNLAYIIKIVRYFFIEKLTKGELVGAIGSFPSLLCKPARDRQAELLNQIAKVGYNSTKESYLHGLKIHMIVTKTGFLVAYSVTNPGVHDVKALETLSEEANFPNILGDRGYISHKIHEKLAPKGITISVPPRKNVDKSEELDRSLLGKQKKTVEITSDRGQKLFQTRSSSLE